MISNASREYTPQLDKVARLYHSQGGSAAEAEASNKSPGALGASQY
jgi:hypothetical protein